MLVSQLATEHGPKEDESEVRRVYVRDGGREMPGGVVPRAAKRRLGEKIKFLKSKAMSSGLTMAKRQRGYGC